MAVRFNCPIYTYEFILDAAGVILEEPEEEEGEEVVGKGTKKKKKTVTAGSALSQYSDDDLTQMLNDVLEEEDYERAAEIRDELKRRQTKDS